MYSSDIKCPYCGSPMESGTNYIRGSILGFMIVGFSWQHLWFRTGNRKEIVVGSGEERVGHRCNECGAVTVYPLKRPWNR